MLKGFSEEKHLIDQQKDSNEENDDLRQIKEFNVQQKNRKNRREDDGRTLLNTFPFDQVDEKGKSHKRKQDNRNNGFEGLQVC